VRLGPPLFSRRRFPLPLGRFPPCSCLSTGLRTLFFLSFSNSALGDSAVFCSPRARPCTCLSLLSLFFRPHLVFYHARFPISPLTCFHLPDRRRARANLSFSFHVRLGPVPPDSSGSLCCVRVAVCVHLQGRGAPLEATIRAQSSALDIIARAPAGGVPPLVSCGPLFTRDVPCNPVWLVCVSRVSPISFRARRFVRSA